MTHQPRTHWDEAPCASNYNLSTDQYKKQFPKDAQKECQKRGQIHQTAGEGDIPMGNLPGGVADVLFLVQHAVIPGIPGQPYAQEPGTYRFRLCRIRTGMLSIIPLIYFIGLSATITFATCKSCTYHKIGADSGWQVIN